MSISYDELMQKKEITKKDLDEFLSDPENRKIAIEKAQEIAGMVFPQYETLDIKTLTIRLPMLLHQAVKDLAYFSDVSMNQIMLESLLDGIDKWEPAEYEFDEHKNRFNEYRETEAFEKTKIKINNARIIAAIIGSKMMFRRDLKK